MRCNTFRKFSKILKNTCSFFFFLFFFFNVFLFYYIYLNLNDRRNSILSSHYERFSNLNYTIVRCTRSYSSSGTSSISSCHVDGVRLFTSDVNRIFQETKQASRLWLIVPPRENEFCQRFMPHLSPFFVIQWNISEKLIDDNMEINYKSLLNTFKISYH